MMIPSVLSSQLVQGVKDFLTTTFHSTTPAFADVMERFVETPGNLFKGPYISIALPFRKGEGSERFFPEILDESFVPYYHQELAFRRLSAEKPEPTLVATGTGSGKTESFMFPILEHCRQHKGSRGIKAIIIYPMNALATDQAKRFAKTIAKTPSLDGVRVGLFVGGEGELHRRMGKEHVITNKTDLRQDPPDVLLTNYKMLDFLLMRPKDQPLWRHNIGTGVLKFLAVDEIHTFDGAQGSDLASLLRRLRAKLKIGQDELACIGTSATLGGECVNAICDFATKVFAQPFDASSVISEHRVDAEEFLADAANDFFNFPLVQELDALDYRSNASMDEYIAAQYRLWFREEPGEVDTPAFKTALGRRLKELSLFKVLLKSVGHEIVPKEKVVEAFRRHIHAAGDDAERYYSALVDSLLALLSWAKGEPLGDYLPPFLHLRVQLWLRELTRMVGSLESRPEIRFSHDLSGKEEKKHYPLIHCRECHAMGWGAVKKEGSDALIDDLDLFYKVFFARDPRLQFIFPIEDGFEPENGRIMKLELATGREATEGDHDTSSIVVWANDTRVEGKARSHNDCPFCGNKNALTILGSRAASLTSVLIGQAFTSGYNDDKKLITFSDSVQDAAHRAGFFGARSWQFTIRGVIQQALDAEGGEVPLSEFSDAVARHWRIKLNDEARYVATMIAPDMTWLRDYETLQKSGKLPAKSDIGNLVDERLDWQVYSEFGYRSHIGRTLERSGAATVRFAPLDSVVDTLLPRLRNDFEPLRGIDAPALERFVLGLLQHMRKQGAIFSAHLGTYVSNGGKIYAFTKYQQMYMPSFTFRSRTPAFLTTGAFSTFEKIHQKLGKSWCDLWLQANFLDDNLLIGGYAEPIYRKVFEALQEKGFVEEKEVQGRAVWGLRPDKMGVTNRVARLECDRCGDVMMTPADDARMTEGMCCLRKGCRGHYTQRELGTDYYRDLFRFGDIERIVAQEHTGLLEREEREWVERSFIERTPLEPWKPNLLSATPTLEMGIDIGDLSTVLLCSTPPGSANYLQRIGRAGRTDGNAFNATVANAQPHDLYFYEEPLEMMRGVIEAPGVFIDASAILQRQFLAFCLDHWVVDENISEEGISRQLAGVLTAMAGKKEEAFPFTLIRYIEAQSEHLLEEFFNLYGEELHERTREQLRVFATGNPEDIRQADMPDELKESQSLAYKILHRLEMVHAERSALKQQIKALNEKLKAHRAIEAKDKDWEEELRRLEAEMAGLKSVLKTIDKRETLEFFTNEGLLPNYAFPESGVLLKSIIYRRKEKVEGSDGAGYESFTFEYERPGSSAISELAPNNRFYAGGRKVTIDQIDMQLSEIETWRFCDRCSYSERERSGMSDRCPRCGSPMWSDAGQKRELLRLRQVMATTNDRQSRLLDDSEQREPLFFTKQLLIDFDKEHVQEAWATQNERMPFGFEFIRKASFREINFGEFSLHGEEVTIAGKRMPRTGFVLCRCCGKVQRGRPGDKEFKPIHAFSCECADPAAEENFVESLYLYREFESEAIRLLLPLTTIDINEEKLHSLIAAFQMGLRAYFKGSVDHLRVGLYEEGEAGEEYRRQYLVLYDAIPGGTGYLRQLMRDDFPVFEVLELAKERLEACVCNEDPDRDGCYRCIYAYRNNFDRPLVSRERAKEIIAQILTFKAQVEKVDTLSGVSTEGLFDSELEALFLRALGSIELPETRVKLREHITRRKRAGYLLELGERRYEIEQQVELGEKEGVAIPSRADFVIYPEKPGEKPIVVFTDGYAFHKDRLALDTAQRMAILQSGNYRLWSITWEDMRPMDKGEDGFVNYLDDGFVNPVLYSRFCQDNEFLRKNSFEWLVEWLHKADTQAWRKRSLAVALGMMTGAIQKSSDTYEVITGLLDDAMKEGIDALNGTLVVGHKSTPDVQIVTLGVNEEIGRNDFAHLYGWVYLDDHLEIEKKAWAGALRLFNLFQFLPHRFFTTAKGLEEGGYVSIDFAAVAKPAIENDWRGIFEDTLDEAKPLVQRLAEQKVPLPEVGYEFVDTSGKIVGEAELAWPDEKVAVCLDNEGLPPVEGWEFFTPEQYDGLIARLKG